MRVKRAGSFLGAQYYLRGDKGARFDFNGHFDVLRLGHDCAS
jgi:hypothetical protein